MADFRGRPLRGRALGDPRGVRRDARRRLGATSAAWTRSSSSSIEAVEWPLKHPELFAEARRPAAQGDLALPARPAAARPCSPRPSATETQVNFISVKGPALLSKYVGESERGVREVFRKAKQAAPCIIFFDEIDALVPSRGGGAADSHVTERVIGQFLAEMDGIEELNGVLVLGATNRPDILDPALLRPGRFDVQVEIPLPDRDARAAIFAIGLRDRPMAEGIMIESLAERTAGFTGAEIQAVCDQAALAAIRAAREAMDLGKPGRVLITADHLASALTQARSRHGSLVEPLRTDGVAKQRSQIRHEGLTMDQSSIYLYCLARAGSVAESRDRGPRAAAWSTSLEVRDLAAVISEVPLR